MYTVAVERSFVAQHFLTVPDPGPEGVVHSHHYTATVEFHGETLGDYAYLLDIDDATAALEAIVAEYRDELLNDRPEFDEDNPSLERFCAVLHDELAARIDAPAVEEVAVTLAEDDVATATYHASL